MHKILIAPSSFGECGSKPLDMLRTAGFNLCLNPYKRKLQTDELITLANGCVGIIAGVEEYSASVLERLTSLRFISRCGVGLDNIDLKKADERGIKVLNTLQGPTDAVSELAIGLILSLLRKINLADRNLKEGKWIKSYGSLLKGKTVGIVGLGRIGRKTAQLIKAFGVRILFTDPNVYEAVSEGAEKVSLETLLRESDIVVLHLSMSSSSYLIRGEEMDKMKREAYIVNLARGGVVDESELYKRLSDGRLGGAALDVFEKEPYNGELTRLENVILTPHMGSYAKEARLKMEIDAVKNLLNVIGGI